MNKEAISKLLKTPLLVVAVGIGILLIILQDCTKNENNNFKGNTESALEQYRISLEQSFAKVVRKINGEREASVMITLEGSFEKVYANNARVEENTEKDKTSEKKLVLAGNGTSGEAPILIREICPRVKGVAVICEGAENKAIEAKIKSAASALFGISELRVYVANGKE